jgi:predicted dehydrogenase
LTMDATIRHCWQKLTGEMVEAIKTDSKPEPSFYEGMRSQEIIDAVLLSSAEQRWVTLPLAGQ